MKNKLWLQVVLSFFLVLSVADADAETNSSAPPKFLNQIFEKVIKDPDFNHGYLKSGCYIRAHWIAQLIHRDGKTPLKVFIQTKSENEKVILKLADGRQASWVFHAVAGFQDSKGQVWVLDTVLDSKVILMSEWLNLIQSQNPTVQLQTRITGAEIYHVDSEQNSEFASYGPPFSDDVMQFIRDGTSDLFLWESLESSESAQD
ncbi:MAG: protein-glutamine glutaminase family protein [Pseudobdellovibrionaceae bacterium]